MMRLIRELVAYLTAQRCIYCGTRQDRPANVCRGIRSTSFRHVYWESR